MKPFDGAISAYFENDAPEVIRQRIKDAGKKDMLNPSYPYTTRMDKLQYEDTLEDLQIELVKLQAWAQSSGARIAVIFEGRDAAGKGGTIKRFIEHMNPRSAKVVALSKPSEEERSQWYFQRYIKHLPSAGGITFFDRSWYNRGVVEHVFGFCNDAQRTLFFDQTPEFEKMLVDDGILVFKLWLTVGRGEQLRRFLDREKSKLKQWKLSGIDVKGLPKWDAYTAAILETLDKTHTDYAPWHVIRTDDKRRARIAALRTVLSRIDYAQKDAKTACPPDPKIAGGPELLDTIL